MRQALLKLTENTEKKKWGKPCHKKQRTKKTQMWGNPCSYILQNKNAKDLRHTSVFFCWKELRVFEKSLINET